MNKIKWSVLVLAVPLSGCFYQTVDNVDIRKAIKYCGSLENVVSIKTTAGGYEFGRCDNKESENLDRVFLESK